MSLQPGNFGPYGHGKKGADAFVKDMKYLFEDKGLDGAVLRGLGFGAKLPTKAKWESTVAAVAASNNPAAFVQKILNLYKGEGINAAAGFGRFNSFGSTTQAADHFLRFYGKREVLARVDFQGMPKKKALEQAVLIRTGLWRQPTADQVKLTKRIISTFLELDLVPEYQENPSSRMYLIDRALGGYPTVVRS